MYVYIHVCECELLSKSFIIHLSSSYYRLSFFFFLGGNIAFQCFVSFSLYSVVCYFRFWGVPYRFTVSCAHL